MHKLKLHPIEVDLTRPESERWGSVSRRDVVAATNLANEAVRSMPLGVMAILSRTFSLMYRASGGLYYGEIKWWADRMKKPAGLVAALQCMYELGHGFESMHNLIFGCTATVVRNGGRLYHARTLDWPLKRIAPATRVVRFVNGARHHYAVTPVGFIGILSGMLPGAYSVSINYAPPQGRPKFDFAPALLLRNVLETCDTYEDAVYALSHTALSTSVFFTVCGVTRSCVIERTARRCAVRQLRQRSIVQANHFVTRDHTKYNAPLKIDAGDGTVFNFSVERERAMRRGLPALLRDPVCNADTQQAILFDPARGTVQVWVR